jgi:hypothetical protein
MSLTYFCRSKSLSLAAFTGVSAGPVKSKHGTLAAANKAKKKNDH